MLVLHGLWSQDYRLCLWAEDSDRGVKSPSQALRSARRHPFAADPKELRQLVAGEPAEVVLLLPSLRSSPLDSPELVRAVERPAPRTAPELLPWTVPVLSVPVDAAIELPDWTRVGGELDVREGMSLRYLAELVGFARQLVERGRVLPALLRDGHGCSAAWQPVLQGPDLLAFSSLVAAMPPVCRAVPGADNPHELVASALSTLTDAAVRAALPQFVMLPRRRGRAAKAEQADRAWAAALTAPDGHFDAEPDELADLAATLSDWAATAEQPPGAARAAFRLTEGVDEDDWRIGFSLQSTVDPSLQVEAEQCWADDGALDRWLPRPQETLLAELGRAARIYPTLADGLRQARPTGLDLDPLAVVEFLTSAAPALHQAGFGVQLPSWWATRPKLGLAAAARTPTDGVVGTKSLVGQDAIIDFDWQLAIGDDTLTEAEIAALAQAKVPLVRHRGQWVIIDPEQVRRGLAFVRAARPEPVSVRELMVLAAGHHDNEQFPLPLVAVSADGWLGELLAGRIGQSMREVTVPAGFVATLRPYQERGLSWLAFLGSLGLGACLADDMGLGKTVQLLALESVCRSADPKSLPTLLVCPMSLVGNWQREAAAFTPGLRVYQHHGRERLRDKELTTQLAQTDLMVTTYATAVRDIDQLAELRWERVVLDEAQAIKNGLSQSAKAVKRLDAAHRVALTGTPVENRLAELWSIMDFLNPGILGTSESFRRRYSIPVERYGEREPAHRLRTITRPYVLRRLKTDPTIIDDLPEKVEMKEYCRLTAEQASLYRAVVEEMMQRINNSEGIERRGLVLATMTKLKQVCDHPALLLHDRSALGARSGEVLRLEELLDEILAEGDKVLCFTQYTEFADMLVPHLVARFGSDVAYLHGGISKKRRDEMVAEFQSEGGPPIFLLSLRAGGVGLTLTAASHVIHLDRWWNPAVENQATDRAFRIGQRRMVQVRKFICSGTLEEKIDELIEGKKALADLVVRDGEGWLTELDTGELQRLFELSAVIDEE